MPALVEREQYTLKTVTPGLPSWIYLRDSEARNKILELSGAKFETIILIDIV